MTLLNIDTNQTLEVHLESLIGEKIGILGIAGSGKSNSAAVVIEELLVHKLPMTIVDIEGEYFGLKEQHDIIVIGRSDNVDLEVDATNASLFATYSVEHGVSMILDVSDFDDGDKIKFMTEYLTALWEAVFKARRPYELVIEEAHEWIPQGKGTPLKELLRRFAKRGRKRGVGMILISQRSPLVDKDILTQSGSRARSPSQKKKQAQWPW